MNDVFDNIPQGTPEPFKKVKTKPNTVAPTVEPTVESPYSIEGLQNDFPTAGALEQFVYTTTGGKISLNLKGRPNDLKYSLALDALLGKSIPAQFTTDENPYLEKTELVPREEIKPVPPSHRDVPDASLEQNRFDTSRLPHPDAGEQAQGHTCDAVFRSYRDGTVTYEILGPVDERPEGHRLNKFGQSQPALIRIVDPRTGEQILRYPNGVFTPVGKVLYEKLQKLDGMDVWTRYIDRTLASVGSEALNNPWNVTE
jgi:hypothetical protein